MQYQLKSKRVREIRLKLMRGYLRLPEVTSDGHAYLQGFCYGVKQVDLDILELLSRRRLSLSLMFIHLNMRRTQPMPYVHQRLKYLASIEMINRLGDVWSITNEAYNAIHEVVDV